MISAAGSRQAEASVQLAVQVSSPKVAPRSACPSVTARPCPTRSSSPAACLRLRSCEIASASDTAKHERRTATNWGRFNAVLHAGSAQFTTLPGADLRGLAAIRALGLQSRFGRF